MTELLDFARPRQARQAWNQLQVELTWQRNCVEKRRFLGSLQIPKQDSEHLLDTVAQNLNCFESLTFNHLSNRFDRYDSEEYWVKIITLALSEYAYYDESEVGFWQSVCDRLSLKNTQGVQKCFRDILKQGFEQLNVVQSRQGNRYVSTLWLQSGIPQQNLEHFAQLLKDISHQHDWWEMSHAAPEDLSFLLYEHCQHRYPQWGKLLTFLSASCSDEKEAVEPISGELLQGLAIVAQALEQEGLEPDILHDRHQRERLLQNFCLPNTFFLRSWDNLIQVLTPRQRESIHHRHIVSLRKKPLFLALDVADSFNVQLVLPAQTLWRSDWSKLRDTFVTLDGTGWESTFPQEHLLEVEAQTHTVSDVLNEWVWRLISHNRETLTEWHCEGVSPDCPILVFDAFTGERLALPHGLKGRAEIICFYEASAQVICSKDIELIDGFVPCNLSSWRGQQFYLNGQQAYLTVQSTNFEKVIAWDSSQSDDCPQLRGLRLRDKKLTYTEMPLVWYPPIDAVRTISIQVEDLNNRKALTDINEQLMLQVNAHWQSIPLSQWIQRSGRYRVQIWNSNHRWSEQFELSSSFEAAPRSLCTARIHEFGEPVEAPIQASSVSNFWLRDLTMRSLWPLEEIRFVLTNSRDEHLFTRQADPQGSLPLNLASLHDILPESEQYALHYYDVCGRKCCLLKVLIEQAVDYYLDAQTIQLSGLQSNQYTLSLWNLLRPEETVSTLSFDINAGVEAFEFLLRDAISDQFGIFHIQLESALQTPLNLGWWSGIQATESLVLPDDANGDCCFSILNNEPVEEFQALFREINLSVDCNRLKDAIASLEHTNHYLPDWLDRSLLQKKLETYLPKVTAVLPVVKKTTDPLPKQTSYLIEVQNSSMHKIFQKMLQPALKKSKIDRQVICVKDRLLYDLIRVELATSDVLPELNRIINRLGDKLGTDVIVKEWKR